MVPEVNGTDLRSPLWSRNPEISLDLASDPWTPPLGRMSDPWKPPLGRMSDPWMPPLGRMLDPGFISSLNKYEFLSHEGAQLRFDLDYSEMPASQDVQGVLQASVSEPGSQFLPGFVVHDASLPNDEVPSSSLASPNLVTSPLVCSLAHEHSGSGLSFDSRDLVSAAIPSRDSTKSAVSDSSLQRRRAGDAPLATNHGQQPRSSLSQVDARPRSVAILSYDHGRADISVNAGEMFFDLNMQSVQPRRLKKKTNQERDSYLSVRRGGACEKHKLAKRAVSTLS